LALLLAGRRLIEEEGGREEEEEGGREEGGREAGKRVEARLAVGRPGEPLTRGGEKREASAYGEGGKKRRTI